MAAVDGRRRATPADQAVQGRQRRRRQARWTPTKVAALVKDYAAKRADRRRRPSGTACWNAVAEYDYDGVILSLVKHYCPPGLLGLALTALLASFMSGMAGNVTAFNTVWTYDLYQAYIAPNKSDEHYMWMGQRDHASSASC